MEQAGVAHQATDLQGHTITLFVVWLCEDLN
jgi:hypothetical protein